jgi:hypothetical protein
MENLMTETVFHSYIFTRVTPILASKLLAELQEAGFVGTVGDFVAASGQVHLSTQQTLNAGAQAAAQAIITAHDPTDYVGDLYADAEAAVVPHLSALLRMGLSSRDLTSAFMARGFAIVNNATQQEIDAIVNRQTGAFYVTSQGFWGWNNLPDQIEWDVLTGAGKTAATYSFMTAQKKFNLKSMLMLEFVLEALIAELLKLRSGD